MDQINRLRFEKDVPLKQTLGTSSICFERPVYVNAASSVVGKKEGEGPLKSFFDLICNDPMFGCKTWEEAEAALQSEAATLVLGKSGLKEEDIRYLFAGDLLSQLIASSFGLEKFNRPLFGLYGACSTCGESLALGSMTIAAGFAKHVMTITSSHFAGAEKQFRFPLEYGNQRPKSATWTVTGAGAFILSNSPLHAHAKITGITPGRIIDAGIHDSMNMGAAMAPAAADSVVQNFKDFGRCEKDYDKIVTGDLGTIGQSLFIDLVKERGYDISSKHMDCGIEIFDSTNQGTDAGGSGCGCSAVVLAAYLLRQLEEGNYKRILFLPTGALLSTVSFNEGNPIPGIAHAVVIESIF